MTLTTDDLYPRCEAERYRLYVRRGEELEILASAADMASIGVAIDQNHKDCQEVGLCFDDLGQVGILDTLAHTSKPPLWTVRGYESRPTGEWIVKPFTRGENI